MPVEQSLNFLFYAVLCFCFSAGFDCRKTPRCPWVALIRQAIAFILAIAAVVLWLAGSVGIILHIISH